jgi:uncharacterized membrane protein
MSSVVRKLFAAATLCWMGLQAAAAVLAGNASISVSTYTVAAGVYFAGALICHQRPDRSFHLGIAQWPVCARCAGLYAGATLGAWFAAALPFRSLERRAVAHPRLVLLTALVPSAITLFYEWTTGVVPPNWVRAASGVLLGAVGAWIVLAASAPTRSVEIH